MWESTGMGKKKCALQTDQWSEQKPVYLFTADLLWHTQLINVRTEAITTV